MKKFAVSLVVMAAGVALVGVPAAVAAPVAGPAAVAVPERTGPDITVSRWSDKRDFTSGTLEGLKLKGGDLEIAKKGSLATLDYTDPFGDGAARSYEYGAWTSPVVELDYPVDEAISSWNTTTPTGTWVEVEFRGLHGDGSWSKWYVLGRWTSGMDFEAGDIHRTSLDGQRDGDGTVWTDTFSAKTGREPVAFQSRVKLLRPEGTRATPSMDSLATMTSQLMPGAPEQTSEFTLGEHTELAVPRYSQNIHKGEYPEFGGGGQVWCSPTSTSMVMAWYGKRHTPSAEDLEGIVAPNGDPQVDFAAMRTWDYTYEGAGNWPFNTAYAHTYGLDAFVTRLRSLAEIERFVAAGIPIVVSLAFDEEEMPEAGYSTNGHLMVVVGFTDDGDPILNDPASNSNDAVRNIYTRENFERVWLDHSGGVSYVFTRPGVHLPANVAGETPNW